MICVKCETEKENGYLCHYIVNITKKTTYGDAIQSETQTQFTTFDEPMFKSFLCVDCLEEDIAGYGKRIKGLIIKSVILVPMLVAGIAASILVSASFIFLNFLILFPSIFVLRDLYQTRFNHKNLLKEKKCEWDHMWFLKYIGNLAAKDQRFREAFLKDLSVPTNLKESVKGSTIEHYFLTKNVEIFEKGERSFVMVR